MKTGTVITPREFEKLKTKAMVESIARTEQRPNRKEMIGDADIVWLKKCLEAKDVLIFIKLV